MINLGFLVVGLGALYALYRRLRDAFYNKDAVNTSGKINLLNNVIDLKNKEVDQAKQTAQEAVNAYEKAKSDDSNNTSGPKNSS